VVYSAEPGTADYDAMVLLDMEGAGLLESTGGARTLNADAHQDADVEHGRSL